MGDGYRALAGQWEWSEATGSRHTARSDFGGFYVKSASLNVLAIHSEGGGCGLDGDQKIRQVSDNHIPDQSPVHPLIFMDDEVPETDNPSPRHSRRPGLDRGCNLAGRFTDDGQASQHCIL